MKKGVQFRVVDSLLVVGFVSALVISSNDPRVAAAVTPYFFFMLGIICLTSGRTRETLYVGAAMHWFCTYVMKPKTQYNHLIWGTFITVLAVAAFITGPKTPALGNGPNDDLPPEPWFWLTVLVVFGLNIAVGVLTQRKEKRQPNQAL